MTTHPFPRNGATEHGNREIARSGEILRTESGSGLHGVSISGTGDHDEMGIYIEPPTAVIGLDGSYDHYVLRSQPNGAHSGQGDTDLVMYSLRKYLRLAIAGNPTVLGPLFAPEPSVYAITETGAGLRSLAETFLSRHAVQRFLGFLDRQQKELSGAGDRRPKTAQRPALVERFGYDVKHASHALRLAYQGREIARHGRMTLPMPPDERQHVRAVRLGEYPLPAVLHDIDSLRQDTMECLDTDCTLPAEPDTTRLSTWSVAAHRAQWGWD